MSSKANDLYREQMFDTFNTTEDGKLRGRIIRELRDNNMSDEADFLSSAVDAERATFLDDNGLTEDDIHVDEIGNEYGTYYMENGNPSEEGYGFIKQIIRVPKRLTIK
jgi:hypothetical protein